MRGKLRKFSFITVAFFCQLIGQISEEEFKKTFKRPDEALLRQIKQAVVIPVLTDDHAKFYSDNISYSIGSETLSASGTATVVYKDLVVQADTLTYDKRTKTLVVKGNVRVFRGPSVIKADEVVLSLDTGEGEFKRADAFFIDSFFSFKADHGRFFKTERFNLFDSRFSSCRCEDGSQPWSFKAKECEIKRDESIRAKNVTFKVFDTPVLYAPYLWLPLEEKRKSGFLMPKLGSSNKHGFTIETPYFIAPSFNSELTLTPFLYQRTRVGARGVSTLLTEDSGFVKGSFVYSNEEFRKERGTLKRQGLNPELYQDPKIDVNRVGGSLSVYQKLAEQRRSYRLDLFIDAKRTSDDLLVREVKNDISRYSAPFLRSFANLRMRTNAAGTFSLGAESVQDFGRFKDRIFDEVPSISHSYTKPFGLLNLGFTSVSTAVKVDSNVTNYVRDKGYEGLRALFSPTVRAKAPVSYLGEISGMYSVGFKFYETRAAETDFEDNLITQRAETTISTKLERILSLSHERFDPQTPQSSIRRMKHSIEPFFGTVYQNNSKDVELVPNFNPVIDRQRDVNALKYGFRTNLTEIRKSEQFVDLNFPEILPDLYDYLGRFESLRHIATEELFSDNTRKKGLAFFEVSELYSLDDAFESTNSKYSNTTVRGSVSPLDNFSLRTRLGYNREDAKLEFGRIGTKSIFESATVYLDYVFKSIKDSEDTSEIISGVRLDLTDRLALGTWFRYDLESNDLYDSYSVVQFAGACRCWFIDLGVEKQKNPDDLKLTFTLVLSGIGDIVQDLPIQLLATEDQTD